MRDVRDRIAQLLERGERPALATVVATRRSAPRPVGSRLVVSEAGELHGSVSGGCVESDVAVQAAEVIADGRPRLLTYGIADDEAWEIGLPCGGEIDVFVQRLEREPPDGEGVLVTVLDGDRAGEQELLPRGALEAGVHELEGRQVFAEAVGPPPRLVVVGAIGSRKTQAKRRERLLDAGVPEEALERLSGPAGLDLGADTPAETAVSILAEILAMRAGRDGGRLRERSGPIHAITG